MKAGILGKLSAVRLKTAVGLYRSERELSIVSAARTPLSSVVLDTRKVTLDSDEEAAMTTIRSVIKELTSAKKPPTLVVGLRASAVTFMSEPSQEEEPAAALLDNADQKQAPASDAKVLMDSIAISAAKTKFVLTGKVRREEVSTTFSYTDEDDPSPRYEPVPWAAWRASTYHAPLKPKRGTHLRYILGPNAGVAIVGNERWPLAWQLLSYEGASKGETMIQAFHLLSLYAKRRLGISTIAEVSAQGDAKLIEGWGIIEDAIGQPVSQLEGPVYDSDMVAFGLALGGLEADTECLDLARSLQKPKTLLAMVPWGQAAFTASLFGLMFGVLWYNSNKLERHLAATQEANAAIVWANGVDIKKLKLEHQTLTREVSPLEKFMKREIYLSEAVTALVKTMPSKIWLEGLHASDQIWERSPNKSLGEQYLIANCGAPLAARKTVAPQIDQLVRDLAEAEYFKEHLPTVKLAEINRKRDGKVTFSLFTVVTMPKKG